MIPSLCPQAQGSNQGQILANACRCCTLLCALAQGTVAAAQADAAARPAEPPAEGQEALAEVLLTITLNHEELHETVAFLRQADGSLWASAKDIRRCRLRAPAVQPEFHKGEAYYPLTAMTGLSYRVDEASQSVSLEAAPKLFASNAVSATLPSPTPEPSTSGGFLNYDGYAQYSQGRTQVNALAELGGFNAWGVGTLDVLGKDLGDQARFVRLDTAWTADMPLRLSTLRLAMPSASPANGAGRCASVASSGRPISPRSPASSAIPCPPWLASRPCRPRSIST